MGKKYVGSYKHDSCMMVLKQVAKILIFFRTTMMFNEIIVSIVVGMFKRFRDNQDTFCVK